MKILFLDASPTMLAKNLLPVANAFHQYDPDFNAIFISLEISSHTDKKIEAESLKRITEKGGYEYQIFKSSSKKKILKFLEEYEFDLIFFGAYRTFDQFWTGIAKSIGIPTYNLQHGFEIDSVYYKPVASLFKYHKCLRIVSYIYGLSKIINVNFLVLIRRYLRYLFVRETLIGTGFDNILLFPNKSFVYSEFYKQFWNKKFGFEHDRMVTVTPSDFLLIPTIKQKKRENACCYITQTITEDGRMNKKEFIKLMYEYKYIAAKVNKFIIKLHPRSNIEQYNCFRDMENVEFTRAFPNCTSYITHYSSLTYTASFFSNLVILHELKGHPTPDVHRLVASHTVTNCEEIIKILEEATDTEEPNLEERKKKINYYAVYEKMDPYEKIYNTIMGDLYPYLLSRQKTGISKVDSSPCIKAVGTLGARRATRVGAAFDYHSGRVK